MKTIIIASIAFCVTVFFLVMWFQMFISIPVILFPVQKHGAGEGIAFLSAA